MVCSAAGCVHIMYDGAKSLEHSSCCTVVSVRLMFPAAGFVHVIDDETKWDANFGRSVLAGLLGLGANVGQARISGFRVHAACCLSRRVKADPPNIVLKQL